MEGFGLVDTTGHTFYYYDDTLPTLLEHNQSGVPAAGGYYGGKSMIFSGVSLGKLARDTQILFGDHECVIDWDAATDSNLECRIVDLETAEDAGVVDITIPNNSDFRCLVEFLEKTSDDGYLPTLCKFEYEDPGVTMLSVAS